ncbi:MAG: hypothetical protein ABEJ02_00265 [Candidatus Paceibacteria bacterium]
MPENSAPETQQPPQFTTREAAERIFEERDLEVRNDEVREQMIDDIEGEINDLFNNKVVKYMSEEGLTDQFDELLDQDPDPAEIREFIQANVDGVDNILSNAILQVRNMYLSRQ